MDVDQSALLTDPLTAGRALDDEYRYLHGSPASKSGPADSSTAPDLDILRRHERAAHAALCLSGGGVRSASFALGVLQGFARAGMLGDFDYLSTVSGGGYIGGWLSAWRLHAHLHNEPDPSRQLAATIGEAEPQPITRLRRVIKFLDPRAGVLSADVWTLAGTVLRNLLVNWMVLIPLIAAAAMMPRLYLGVLGLPSQPELVSRSTLNWWYVHDLIPIVVLIGVATLYAALSLPSLGHRSNGVGGFIVWFLTPVIAAYVLFSVHRYWAWRFGDDEAPFGVELLLSSAGMVLPWVVGGALSRRWWRPWTWIAAGVAGAAAHFARWSTHRFLDDFAQHDPQAFCVLDLTATLLMLFLQITLFIGLASRDMTDEDREWWARAGAWLLIVAVTWLAASGVVILGPLLLQAGVDALGLSYENGRAGLGFFTLLSGGAAYRMGAAWTSESGRWRQLQQIGFMIAAPAIMILLVVLVSDANQILLQGLHDFGLFRELPHPVGASLPEDLLALALLLAIGLALGHLVSINQFSLHGMYRDRLVRTFLGVSRPGTERRASPFTGFDGADDFPFSRAAALVRPLHVVNTTLNLVGDNRLANAERKAASFTISPLHAGSRDIGYRPTDQYAGGITLGEAVTTSGAAVSPNMGAASSPTLTFLLTVFNARLGVWLGNPGMPGDARWMKASPDFGVKPLVYELLGRTTARNPYVYLSDGGHFENLALYEMIFRRCRYIVVSDAGADGAYVFDDLANAIRQVRLDFGIDIDFPAGGPQRQARWAIGTIRYSAIDAEAQDGILIYLKPTLIGDEPVDVENYGRTHPAFPQQPTTEQWFDSAQFESYRRLGLHTVSSLCGNAQFTTVRDLCLAVTARPRSAPARTPPSPRLDPAP